jgi:hypothetical protein
MRARNLKPDVFSDERLGECSAEARWLYLSLFCQADRDGRLEDRPKRIRAMGAPYDAADPDAMLSQLADRGLILRYEVDGRKLIQVIDFASSQNPHPKEQSFNLPPPPPGKAAASPEITRPAAASPEITRQAEESNNLARLTPSSLTPSSLTPSSGAPSERKRARRPADAAGFDRFWAAYPKKSAKQAAQKAWAKLKPDAELVERIVAAVERHKLTEQWRRNIITHPATWLNGRRWEDEVAPDAGGEYTQAEIDAALGPPRYPSKEELASIFGSANGEGEGGAPC